MKVILGSSSASRKKLLSSFGFHFSIEKSVFEENLDMKSFNTPEEYCLATAEGKYADLSSRLSDYDVLICADSICVTENGLILEKP